MEEHPILFSTEMVKAILDGSKTQTRRVIKLSRSWFDENGKLVDTNYWKGEDLVKTIKCPYGQVGDHLWCKETWASDCTCENPECNGVIYKAGYAGKIIPDKWRPSIFLPRKFSRITLEITEVRVQRLQEISEADIIAEGCWWDTFNMGGKLLHQGDVPDIWYRHLWNSINGKKYPWESDPWVWAITFKVIRQQ
jgi:hypothetical protein